MLTAFPVTGPPQHLVMAVISNIDCALPDIGALHDQLEAELSKRLLGGVPVLVDDPACSAAIAAFSINAATSAGAKESLHGRREIQ